VSARPPREPTRIPPPETPPEPHRPLSENEHEVRLLHNDPGQLIIDYRSMIGIVVWNAIKRGMFPPGEHRELIQAVTVKLLELLPGIRRSYDGTSLLRTYVSVVVVNILNRMARGQSHPARSLLPREAGMEDPALELPDHDIQVFIRRLDRILRLFAAEQPKLAVVLKCYYRIALDESEVRAWYPACDPFSRDQLRALSRTGTGELAYGALFTALAPIVSEAEGRRVTADSLRKWTDHRIGQILRLLNGNPPHSSFDRKTLGDLFERLSISPGERTI
jgi:hypothetical protein